ncbi:hypothetical protein NKJ26_14965 [Mesorhizobium sp. M0152]|uniref:hypothetical protein n=1 Tax=Mesorhizobium sp. M0152 TaxID=2956898 RepID=UPI0033370AC8
MSIAKARVQDNRYVDPLLKQRAGNGVICPMAAATSAGGIVDAVAGHHRRCQGFLGFSIRRPPSETGLVEATLELR